MENLHTYIEIGLACLSGISTIIYFVVVFTRANKEKKIEMLKNAMLGMMEEAEKFKNYTAEEKKQYVFTRAKEFILDQKLKFSDSQLSSVIERQIEFSNNVNVNKGKK